MTTVTYKNGILAADSQITNGNCVEGNDDKIIKIADGYVGWSGSLQAKTEFMKFIEGEEYDEEILKDQENYTFECIVVRNDGEIEVYCDGTVVETYGAEFYAFGSGKDFAKGAMMVGATAKEAVKIAAKLDIYTGGKIKTVRI